MCNDKSKFNFWIQVFQHMKKVNRGTVILKIEYENELNQCNFELHDFFYVPDLHLNLISVPKITNEGFCSVNFKKNTCWITKK